MSARIGTHEIRNPIDPQPTPEFPIEKLRRFAQRHPLPARVSRFHGGVLLVSDIAKSSGIGVFYGRTCGGRDTV